MNVSLFNAKLNIHMWAFLWLSGKKFTCHCRRCRRRGFNPWVRKIPWKRKRQPTPIFLPGKSHGQRSLMGYSPWNPKESYTTEQLSMHVYVCTSVCIYTQKTSFIITTYTKIIRISNSKCAKYLCK